jgi:hypothetical protein
MAIMLERFRMTIAEVEDAFVEISKQIFESDKRHLLTLVRRFQYYRKVSVRFDEEKLNQAILAQIGR